ncbi:hypothetical protein [Micromonospora aurantiaca (nom. illeg.)]|uniref:hypothetical protein n=1 Tax=Micromonospora aurantiaca (nom. illeg.) TaxID=47850 RepID=UPI0008280C7A|nr:hypothetical protein [Micromonospora aurantiaca]SCL40124.1 hypothetical protein GA0070615_4290 [Micromonospora aurantiaca]
MDGETLYVIDDHAVLKIPTLCGVSSLPHVLDELTDMVKSGRLCFPDQIVHDCAKWATGETIHTWIKAVSGHRQLRKLPSKWQEEVLGICEELCDYDDENEQSPVLVAAMSLMISQDYPASALNVVTEDRSNLPTRMCLNEACPTLGLTAITARDFLSATPASRYLI